MVCLQETKRTHIDLSFIHNFCNAQFDCFQYIPSVGASGGSCIFWKSSVFSGSLIFQNEYANSVLLTSVHSNASWVLTNVYAPCTPLGKRDFINWFQGIQMPNNVDWLLAGDFNFYRNPEDRSRPGADVNEMLLFNGAISALGLVEFPLKGQRFTWTNKQCPPLLKRLDWFFTSATWTISYPNTSVSTLVMETSDHVPCLISISTSIPKGSIFRFENFWLQHDDFLNQVQSGWHSPSFFADAARNITAKFKNLRKLLRAWNQTISSLKENIRNIKLFISFLNLIEEFRDLSLPEWNFKKLLESKLISLLKQ